MPLQASRSAMIFLLLLIFVSHSNAGSGLNVNEWTKTGRGELSWEAGSVVIRDCILEHIDTLDQPFEFSFEARAVEDAEQVQIWAGIAMKDRNNRYMLGLRGGNNDDLFLRRRKTLGKDKLLSLKPLEFHPEIAKWYKIRIISKENFIGVFLGDEKKPRIIIKDDNPLDCGSVYLGGGWIKSEYRNIQIRKLEKDFVLPLQSSNGKPDNKTSAKESRRVLERKSYQPVKIEAIRIGRTEILLDGKWLFMPEHEIAGGSPWLENTSDKQWHLMDVPQYWNPVSNWMYGWEKGLNQPPSGVSDNYNEKELERCNNYTFDWRNTQAAWYRHWLDIPEIPDDKRIKLHFDAVSKVAAVYVNNKLAGEHVGMFADFTIDITELIKPGLNLIAVNVKVRKTEAAADAQKTVARAVTVDITNDMLNSLPHGMYQGTEGGIWQPVKLIISEQLYIDDVFAKVHLQGGSFEISLKNEGETDQHVSLDMEILDDDNKLFFKTQVQETILLKAGTDKKVISRVENLAPKHWSPEEPNLYKLLVNLRDKKQLVDRKKISIGFRTVSVKGDKVLLNGKPYFMRGANHLPSGIAANNARLANTLLKLMHDGNQMVTRTHGSVFTETWMNAADRQGVGVSFEGTWPWLMINSIPSEELLKIWKEETIALARKYRNHPSLLVWTMNNEMYFTMFYHNDPKDVRLKKWKYLTEVIEEVRKLIPGLPISADSGYDQLKADYENNLKPNNIDDGDLDDRHIYFNWYNRDFFQIINGEWTERIYWTPGANPDRPFFPQEVSTGYPNNDEGHFTRKYIDKHQVPQAFVGDWAWEDRDPAYGLERHAFMTKELSEIIRRTAPETAGFLLFANTCWYRDIWNSSLLEPYPVHGAVKTAFQPVLVSAELEGRNFWTGTNIEPEIYVVHHDINHGKLVDLELYWKILYDNKILSQGNVPFASTNYYSASQQKVKISLPESLDTPKAECHLELQLYNKGKQISQNEYNLSLADKKWLDDIKKLGNKKIALFDITGKTRAVFEQFQIPFFELKDLTEIRTRSMDMLVVANLDADNEVPYNWEDVRRMAGNGLDVLLIHPGKHLKWLYYYEVESVYEREGRIAHMKVPEHEVFADIEPEELSWWQPADGNRPGVCRRSFRFRKDQGISKLVEYLRPHVYLSDPEYQLYEMTGYPLVEFQENVGKIIASEMQLNRAVDDPVAGRMLINILLYLNSSDFE